MIAERRTFADFLELARSMPSYVDPPEDGAPAGQEGKTDNGTSSSALGQEPPEILVSTDEPKVGDKAIQALAANPAVYQRGGRLVQIVRDEHRPKGVERPPAAPRISPIPVATLREMMAGSARWRKIKETKGDDIVVDAHPPKWAVDAVFVRGRYPGVRPIEAIVETPVIRSDGSVIEQPGYDELTGLFYEPHDEIPPLLDCPTLDDANAAMEELLEVVVDFPFTDHSHRSGWIAGVLTPLARFAINGPTPMFVYNAPEKGSGKNLAGDSTGLIVCGTKMTRMPNPTSDEEMRKKIMSIAIEGITSILIDNIDTTGKLGCASLDSALTATTWRDRLMGTNSTTGEIPLFTIWYATGNNITFNDDTTRRVVNIRIEPQEESPENRCEFKHPDLLGWIRLERPRLVRAALTILKAYFAAGRPPQGIKSWGSYEEWSSIVREAIVWCGQPDPYDAREELSQQSHGGKSALKMLIEGWAELPCDEGQHTAELTIAELFKVLDENSRRSRNNAGSSDHEPLRYELLRSAIEEISGSQKDQLPRPRAFGMKLTKFRGRIINGQTLRSRQNRDGTWVYFVQTVAGNAGNAGIPTAPPPTRGSIPSSTNGNAENDVKRIGNEGNESPHYQHSPRADTHSQACQHSRTLDFADGFGRVDIYCADCNSHLGTK